MARVFLWMFISIFEPFFQPLSDELSTKSANRKNTLTYYKTKSKKKF